MGVETTLQTLLTATGIPTFLYNKPQGVSLPKIVYQRITKTPTRSHSGRSLDIDYYQVTVWSTTYSAGLAIVDTIVASLDLNTTNFQLSYLDNQIETKDIEANLFQFILEFTIFTRP